MLVVLLLALFMRGVGGGIIVMHIFRGPIGAAPTGRDSIGRVRVFPLCLRVCVVFIVYIVCLFVHFADN